MCDLGLSTFVDLELRGKQLPLSSQMASGKSSGNHWQETIFHSWHDAKGLTSLSPVSVYGAMGCFLSRVTRHIDYTI